MPPETLSNRQLNRATLARQMLLERHSISPLKAVERLAGLQAQEPKPPFIGLWSRLESFDAADLSKALRTRKLVRATAMRATLHTLSVRDYIAWRGALQPVLSSTMKALGARAEGLEVEKVLSAAREHLLEAPLTFTELRALLVAQFPKVNERALGFAVRMNLPLVMLPTDDRWAFPSVAKFTLADEWTGCKLEDDDNASNLVRSYLGAFGPASVMDFQTWSGLKGAKPTFEILRPKLKTFRSESGRELFDLSSAPRPDEEVAAPPRFLPEFDSLVLAHADRTRVIPAEHRGLLVTKNLRVQSVFLHDGIASGAWKIERKGKKATLLLTPFAALPKKTLKTLEAEGESLLRFVEEDAQTFDLKVAK